jgi:hypothetical protein
VTDDEVQIVSSRRKHSENHAFQITHLAKNASKLRSMLSLIGVAEASRILLLPALKRDTRHVQLWGRYCPVWTRRDQGDEEAPPARKQ